MPNDTSTDRADACGIHTGDIRVNRVVDVYRDVVAVRRIVDLGVDADVRRINLAAQCYYNCACARGALRSKNAGTARDPVNCASSRGGNDNVAVAAGVRRVDIVQISGIGGNRRAA